MLLTGSIVFVVRVVVIAGSIRGIASEIVVIKIYAVWCFQVKSRRKDRRMCGD